MLLLDNQRIEQQHIGYVHNVPIRKEQIVTSVNDINQISDFVESVRLDQNPEDGPAVQQLRLNAMEQAQTHADKTIIEAEKFQVTVQEPGRISHGVDFNATGDCGNILNIGSGVSDDDFFHLTCHIEPNLHSQNRERRIC